MRGLIRVLLMVCLLLAIDETEAREWVSRDGRFTVQAELLSVDAGQVVLRREGGMLVRVPIERLSLGDVKYVQEALEAAGQTLPRPKATATPDEVTPATSPQMASPQTEPKGPPLAQRGRVQWQAAPDPVPLGCDFPPGMSFEIPVPSRHSNPFVMFPSTPSPFVLLESEADRDARQLWDLRKGEAVGELDVAIDRNTTAALSPDGQYLAYTNFETLGEVRIWSFSTGQVVHKLRSPDLLSTVTFLAFAGSRRLIVGEPVADAHLVYDVQSGKQIGTVDVKPQLDDKGRVLSPGGNYLVVWSDGQLLVHDTRNGIRAGSLKTKSKRFERPTCLTFSADSKELAGCFPHGLGILIQVWDMADGKEVVTHRFAEDPKRKLGNVTYRGDPLQWLADRDGWLLSGVAVVDRESGQFVWQDREAIQMKDVLPRRIVDANRMLTFRKKEDQHTLCLVPIPKEEIEKSRAMVEAGGTAADAGLPPVTKIDMQGAKEVMWSRAPWTYRASVQALPPKALQRNRLRLGSGLYDYSRTFFSRPDTARVAIGSRLNTSNAPWKLQDLPQTCHLYDLQSGEQLAKFDVPYPTEFMDLSPDGKLGLFRIASSKDRLDIWDLTSGQHVLGFRPSDSENSGERSIDSARFIDESHVVTVVNNGRLVVWKLPECQAVYTSPPEFRRLAGMTRDRKTMVIVSGRTPHFIDALTGKIIGSLPEVESEEIIVLPRAGFSQDENQLAVLFTNDDECVLAAWDLTDGSMSLKLELPFNAIWPVWCGPDHVLLNRSAWYDDPDAMIDVRQGLVVWNYEAADGTSLRSSPDHRCWFGCRFAGPNEFAAVDLPDQKVHAILSQVQMPEPLIGPTATLTVQTQIEDPPLEIPPGWSDLENLDEDLYQHFLKHLQDKQVNVVVRGSTRLVVGIRQEKQEETMSVGRLFGPSRTVLLSATRLIPYVAVFDSDGNQVWSIQPRKNELKPADLNDCPGGMDKATYMKLQQWETAVEWLRSQQIPCPLFHPNAHSGLGESLVTPEKLRIRRSPTPEQMKPKKNLQDKTAGVSAGGAERSG